MLTFLVRTVMTTVAMHLIRGVVGYMASSLNRHQNQNRQAPAPVPPGPRRINIDRQNIVDAKFEEVSDKRADRK